MAPVWTEHLCGLREKIPLAIDDLDKLLAKKARPNFVAACETYVCDNARRLTKLWLSSLSEQSLADTYPHFYKLVFEWLSGLNVLRDILLPSYLQKDMVSEWKGHLCWLQSAFHQLEWDDGLLKLSAMQSRPDFVNRCERYVIKNSGRLTKKWLSSVSSKSTGYPQLSKLVVERLLSTLNWLVFLERSYASRYHFICIPS